jgi:integrase
VARPRVGSVFRHGDHFDMRITLPDGSRSRPKCLAPTVTERQARAEAERLTKLAATLGAVRADAPGSAAPRARPVTMTQVADRWVELVKGSALAPSTKAQHGMNANAIKDRFGKMLPDQVTTPLLRAWLRDMKGRVSASRTRSVFFTLSKMFDDAAAEDWIADANPCRHAKVREEVPPLEAPDDEDKAHHTEAEVARLLTATKAPERVVRYVLAFTSGMRDGELAGLRWEDVSEEKGVAILRIRGAVARYGDEGWATRRTTKTKASRRTIPIHPYAAKVLATWRESGWAAFVGRPPKDTDPVLPSAEGLPWRPRSSEFLRVDLEAADLPTKFGGALFEFRSTRRSFATWLESHGVSGETIDRLLGHSGTSVRRRHYSATDLEVLARAVATIRIGKGNDDSDPTDPGPGSGPREASRTEPASSPPPVVAPSPSLPSAPLEGARVGGVSSAGIVRAPSGEGGRSIQPPVILASEALGRLAPPPVFKTGVGHPTVSWAGSIPVRFRQVTRRAPKAGLRATYEELEPALTRWGRAASS